jgi:hypothetical protein
MVQARMGPERKEVLDALRGRGYAPLAAGAASAALELDVSGLERLSESWERLPRDAYLRDGGHYRARRHSCYVQSIADAHLTPAPPRAHWQPTSYNALHGGLLRWFEPFEPEVAAAPALRSLIGSLGRLFAEVTPATRWYIEAHQFRIDSAAGIGRPTPEGAHRDGVDFVAVVLVARRSVRGGETRVFDAHGTTGERFTMTEPWSMLLMDDARVIHETTPIQAEAGIGIRDTLVLTYRERGFQEPPAG